MYEVKIKVQCSVAPSLTDTTVSQHVGHSCSVGLLLLLVLRLVLRLIQRLVLRFILRLGPGLGLGLGLGLAVGQGGRGRGGGGRALDGAVDPGLRALQVWIDVRRGGHHGGLSGHRRLIFRA